MNTDKFKGFIKNIAMVILLISFFAGIVNFYMTGSRKLFLIITSVLSLAVITYKIINSINAIKTSDDPQEISRQKSALPKLIIVDVILLILAAVIFVYFI